MKVVKTLKKLKFWSRKKKKKKTQLITDQYYPLPPPPCYCSYSWVPVQPSAPPLPPWFESKQTHIQAESGRIGPSRPEFVPQEIVPELNSLDPEARDSCASYQQYMVPNPVYGVPLVPAVRREKAAGVFGCVLNIGRHLIRCFFPCFHVREDRSEIFVVQ